MNRGDLSCALLYDNSIDHRPPNPGRARNLAPIDLRVLKGGKLDFHRSRPVRVATVCEQPPHWTDYVLPAGDPVVSTFDMLQENILPSRLEHPEDFLENRRGIFRGAEHHGHDHSVKTGIRKRK